MIENNYQISFKRNSSTKFNKAAVKTINRVLDEPYSLDIKNELLTRIFHDYSKINHNKITEKNKSFYQRLIDLYIKLEKINNPQDAIGIQTVKRAIDIMR